MCGLPFKPGVNELEKAGLTAIPSRRLQPPRIAECRAHFECKVEWTRPSLYRVMICGKVEAVSIDDGCMDANGSIVWDQVKPAHYCGMRYRDRFVPAYDRPTRGVWRYDGHDEEFRPGENWRDASAARIEHTDRGYWSNARIVLGHGQSANTVIHPTPQTRRRR